MQVIFDVQHLYYLPQFLPVFEELQRRDVDALFVFHQELDSNELLDVVLAESNLPHIRVTSAVAAHREYVSRKPDWLVFGNGYGRLDELPAATRTALLYHGIGVKECYYDPGLMRTDMRFVEGAYREQELRKRYPDAPMRAVGFAKLDPLFGPPMSRPGFDLAAAGLDPDRPTLLYAPTFYPSSIEMLPADFPAHVADCNLLVKPHHFTLTKKRYRRQLEHLRKWERHGNVWLAGVEDVSLLPMMATASLLISEASSALFEFAALDKPVVWCDFYYRRWSHRGVLKSRLDKRLDRTIEKYSDIAAHASRAENLAGVVLGELAAPERLSSKRKETTRKLIGPTDGQVSVRIADELVNER